MTEPSSGPDPAGRRRRRRSRKGRGPGQRPSGSQGLRPGDSPGHRAGGPAARELRPDEELRSSGPAASEAEAAPERWKGYLLNPFQRKAVQAIRGGHNVLVSAPTGAGKTLVAEYAIEDAVQRGRRCIYTSPIKALSNQKYRDFRDDPTIDVGILTGDVTIRPTARVLIMTTEILRNSIFENPEHLAEVEYVVFDEVHYMDDLERGSVWEESLIFAPETMRFICLSATIPNVHELGDWLREIRGPDMVVIQSSKRPVPLHHEMYTARTGLFELADVERVRKRELEAAGKMGPARFRRRIRGGRRDRRGRGDELTESPDPMPLFDRLQREDLLPALVFSFSRKDCERLARWNEGRELLDETEREAMAALQDELVRLYQLDAAVKDGELMGMARRGIAYHHAGMLPVEKELVERMFTSGLLKLLFTTETFALGINMPARTAVFASLRKFDGVSFDYMQTRDYLQMAGRAGRQGKDEEGLVISMLSPKDLAEAPLKRLVLGTPEPVRSRFSLSFSSLLHLVERLGRERVHEAWEKSFNQFQHRKGTAKQQERNRKQQRSVLEAHLEFLEEMKYLEGGKLTPRGKVAKQINGYELQIAELLFSGALENLPETALAVVFVGLVYEERRRGDSGYVPAKVFGNVRSRVQSEIHALAMRAANHELYTSIKRPDWGLSEITARWMDGEEFEAIEESTDVTPGDIVRHFRMAVQLMRQVRRAIDREWDLRESLLAAMDRMNRDVVDARRQLELG